MARTELSWQVKHGDKGDYCDYRGRESKYVFSTPEKLITDFQRDMARWNDENDHS